MRFAIFAVSASVIHAVKKSCDHSCNNKHIHNYADKYNIIEANTENDQNNNGNNKIYNGSEDEAKKMNPYDYENVKAEVSGKFDVNNIDDNDKKDRKDIPDRKSNKGDTINEKMDNKKNENVDKYNVINGNV